MTPTAPTWGDVEDFLGADGWRQLEKGGREGSRSRRVFYETGPVEHEPWVVAVLVGELHMTAEQIAALGEEEARRLVHERWSRPT